MKYLILLVVLISGCAEGPLKRCDGPAVDADLWHCPDQVQGPYRKCEKPVDLYRCQAPQ